MEFGLKIMGYRFGESTLLKTDVLTKQSISIENQARIWPKEEGYPYIPMFYCLEEIRNNLSEVLKIIVGSFEEEAAVHFVISINGSGPGRVQYKDVTDVIENNCTSYSIIDGSCSGSITSIPLFAELLNDGFYAISYISISDRARNFNNNTPLLSINYGDVISYYVIAKSSYRYRVIDIKEFNDTKVMDSKIYEKSSRNALVANSKIYKYERLAFEVLANEIEYINDAYVILPRLSSENREYVSSLFGGRGQLRHETWPLAIFSGSNWVIDFTDIFNNSNKYEKVSVLAIGVGFCWAAMQLERV